MNDVVQPSVCALKLACALCDTRMCPILSYTNNYKGSTRSPQRVTCPGSSARLKVQDCWQKPKDVQQVDCLQCSQFQWDASDLFYALLLLVRPVVSEIFQLTG